MNGRMRQKVGDIEKFCDELGRILPESAQDYEGNFEKKAACERYFEKIVEAIVDLAYLWIRDNGLKMPEEDKQAFGIICDAEIITKPLEEKLKNAKGMRNILAHEYGGVDDKLVFRALREELIPDARAFISAVKAAEKRKERR